MKHKSISILLVVFALFTFNARAAEKMAMDAPALFNSESAASGDFTMIVSGNGKIVAKPKAIFTTGGHYEGTALPYLISTPKSILYPRWAVRQGWKGKLVLAIEVFENGTVGKYKVMQSTGYKMLDEAAIKAVQTWVFSPALKDGKAFHTCVQIPILFDLQD